MNLKYRMLGVVTVKKRTDEIKVRLTREEKAALTKRAKECGYSRESYIRVMLSGHVPRPVPPPDYHSMMREMHSIGNNLNQVAQKAHILNVIDTARYDEALRRFAEVVARIEEAVILPQAE
jgi:hypothetical protein